MFSGSLSSSQESGIVPTRNDAPKTANNTDALIADFANLRMPS